MPRVSTPSRRGGKPDPRPLARTAASVKAAQASTSGTAWRHPAELDYITTGWTDMQIIRFVAASAFSIGPQPQHSRENIISVVLRSRPGEIYIPRAYRIPLLWVAKYISTSLRLVLTCDPQFLEKEWNTYKYEILHVSRLWRALLDAADAVGPDIPRDWRYATFDRPLRRYWHKWLPQSDNFVRDFWNEFGEEEFETDVLKLAWSTWVKQGHRGFLLEKECVADGLSADQFLDGLVINDRADTFEWSIGGEPGSGVSPNVADFCSLPTPISPPATAPAVPLPPPVVRVPLPGELRRQKMKQNDLQVKQEPIEEQQPLSMNAKGKQKAIEHAYPSPPTEPEAGSSRAVSRAETMDVDPSPPPTTIPFSLSPTRFRSQMGSLAPGRGVGRLSIPQPEEDEDDVLDAVVKSEPLEPTPPPPHPNDLIILDDDDPGLGELDLEYPEDEHPPALDSVSGTGFRRSTSSLSSLTSIHSSHAVATPPPITGTTCVSRHGSSRARSLLQDGEYSPNGSHYEHEFRFSFQPTAVDWSDTGKSKGGGGDWIDTHPVVVQLRAELAEEKGRVVALEAELQALKGATYDDDEADAEASAEASVPVREMSHPLQHLF
ncbi:hypothetical protein HMN09_00176700 [Mycena chlorophos]|uniref:Uncharacterized protein n=1 Tax=Mycena chlorophos TaxID=658473 RepID=A0A8H6TKY8_MYCCL|nr:hypothetical protein HMN09_00176700 [Mycena chlorophos]